MSLVADTVAVLSASQLDQAYLDYFTSRFNQTATIPGRWWSYPNFIGHRRNHDCQIINDSLILIGGRHQSTVEVFNFVQNTHQKVRNESFLHVNHFISVAVDPIDPMQSNEIEWELWLACGFQGHAVDGERSKSSISIVKKYRKSQQLEFSEGPSLPTPRGACSADLLHLKGESNPGYVCVFAGSDGSHDKGRFVQNVDCYDRVSKQWIPLKPSPVPLDHHSMVKLPEVQCPNNQTIGPAVLLFHGRTQSYGKPISEMYALPLPKASSTKSPAELFEEYQQQDWKLFLRDLYPRDAAGSVLSDDGRYLIVFGGIGHHISNGYSQDFMREIRYLDLCTKEWHNSPLSFHIPRFALQACRHPRYPMVCGGTYIFNTSSPGKTEPEEPLPWHTNLATCELFDMRGILRESK